ncbi:MAG: septal ring lytic transglycosylase RlpA family protein [Ignavibacteriota bacterium]
MKLRILYRLIFFTAIVFLVGCSSSARYSKSIDENEKKTDIRELGILETETGTASYYADEFNGRKTSNGEIYDMNDFTAAHPSYPFNTMLKVTNLKNGMTVEVRINDRMPQFKKRIIDLSIAAAKKIEMINAGIQEVKIEVISWGK